MATPQVKDLVLRSPAGSSDVITFAWPLQVGHGQDKHDNGIDIIDTIKYVCDELPSISSAFEEINLYQIDTACYKTMTNLVDRFNKAVDSIVALEKGTSLPAERLNKFAHPSLLRHILQLVYNAAVIEPDKLNQYEPFSPEVYGETSYELVQQMLKHVVVSKEDTFIDLGSGVGQVVLQMAGSFPLKTCIGIEKADTPARYAERMDLFFRQYMGWFGKRFCEYKLIKGDFLVDEHREKITSSTLVFVNNFAFGPTVDHQLKERFADLRDGARVVSSKSFCPLNFRITDRNLSDIGTIMHVSEIPPLKGSVSWTCKPVSYYLHVIDRTILERYFQRLKTKGSDNDHVGSVRTTRDRAKREANIGSGSTHQNNNHNNNHNNNNNHQQKEREQSNGGTTSRHQSQSPANVSGTVGSGLASKTTRQQAQQQQQQQQQQQRSLDMDSTSDSDGDATTGNGGNTTTATNTTSTSNGGPMTRKVWSDWCSSKGKSSQSDEEENNNSNGGPAGGSGLGRQSRATTTVQKKRKKLTRKAAIASKSAAAAQRAEAEAAAAAAAASTSKDSSSKEDQPPRAASTGPGGRKGRMKKGARGRKCLNIAGLDVLHKQTVLSTSLDAMTKKLPAAPGTVDQQLTSLLTENMDHNELDIPLVPQDTPYALQILLDVFRSQYMSMIDHMKSSAYLPQVQKQIAQEQERMARLKNRASQLDKQIKVLIDDSVALLKIRMNELGISVNSPNDLIAQAKEIVGRHKDLQHTVSKMRNEVTFYEGEQKLLLSKQLKHLPEYQKLFGNSLNGKVKVEMPQELSETTAQELVLKEIANTLSQRKKLYAQVSTIEQETSVLQKTAEERTTAAVLLAQGTNISLASNSSSSSSSTTTTTVSTNPAPPPPPLPPTSSSSSSSLSTSSSLSVSVPNCKQTTSNSNTSNHVKNSRRSREREHRARSQEWPEVPEVGKIQESNPEVLAQKIVETCRQIEAGHYQVNGKNKANNDVVQPGPSPSTSAAKSSFKDSTLMPAPKQQQQMQLLSSILPKCEIPGLSSSPSASSSSSSSTCSLTVGGRTASIKQESPKVANFEDRLKSIITTALNEDQEQRSKASTSIISSGTPIDSLPPTPTQSPAPKRSKQQQLQLQQQQQQQQNQMHSLHNIITVSTQGLMHLNANTTISPITPPLPGPGAGATASTAPPPPANLPYGAGAGAYGGGGTGKNHTTGKYHQIPIKETKYSPARHGQQAQLPPTPTSSHMASLYAASSGSSGTGNAAAAAAAAIAAPPVSSAAGQLNDLGYGQRRRGTVTASSYEHFMVQQQQQQQQHALMMAAAAHVAQRQQMRAEEQQQQQPPHQQQQQQQHRLTQHLLHHQHQHHHPSHHPNEFKAPAENLQLQRSSSREQLMLDQPQSHLELLPRSSSANSLDYGNTSGGGGSYRGRPSRPSSNSSQPDYTQVSPAKMALRRHLSQEKLNQPPQVTPPPPPQQTSSVSGGGKTIGDLVNGEIERTLEISHQCIINAVVNMSTTGVGATAAHFMERPFSNERLLINLNAQRPERVNIRPIQEDHHSSSSEPTNYSQSQQQAAGSNLATLAHVAYAQKSQRTMPSSSSSSSSSSSTTAGGSVRSGRDYQPVALPRAEMKGCIEAYFHEEQQQQQQQKTKSAAGGVGRGSRLNGANPPLEGLAASLQDHVRARKYKEENEERQRRAAAAATSSTTVASSSTGPNAELSAHYPHQAPPAHSYMHHHHQQQQSQHQHLNGTPNKVEIGMKRTSPLAPHHQPPRPAKLAHFEPQQHLYSANGQVVLPPPPTAHEATTSPSPTPSSSSSSCGGGGRRSKLLIDPPLLMSPEINSLMGDERPLPLSTHHHQQQQQQQQQPLHHHHQVAHVGHQQHRLPLHGQHSTTPTLNLVAARSSSSSSNNNATAADDDDVIAADDESHWQHRVSSGFDRLVAFASTELDKTRRSIDGDTVPASISCNTSPDSGITTHSSSNSDAARTFLSTSSSSSQLELPPSSNQSQSLYNSQTHNLNSHHHSLQQLPQPQQLQLPHQQQQPHHLGADHLSDSSMKSTASSSLAASNSLKTISPVDPSAIESPPLSDVGLPRTPSPSAVSVATPPPMANVPSIIMGNELRIPLKYQRKSKIGSEKHYKKKFCERNWEYDCEDELLAYSNSSAPATAADAAGNGPAPIDCNVSGVGVNVATKSGKSPKEKSSPHHHQQQQQHNHKSSKFRPKGKDWDWSLDSRSQSGELMSTTTTGSNSSTTTTSN